LVRRNPCSKVPEDELGQEIVKLKPHISPNSAYTALKFIEQLESSSMNPYPDCDR
jgi:hypothetical protein